MQNENLDKSELLSIQAKSVLELCSEVDILLENYEGKSINNKEEVF